MALVIFFVPDPARGVAEMVRVVCPGGTVTTYAWDMLGGGFPLEPIQAEMRAMGLKPVLPPSAGASRMDALRSLWTGAGLEAVETREITVQRTFADFDDSGRPACWPRAFDRWSPQWRPAMSNGSRHGCASACRQTPRGALPTVHAPTRQRAACQRNHAA